MNTLAWIVVLVVTNAITLLLASICAAAGAEGAYTEGYERGREVGRGEAYEAAMRGAEPEERGAM